MHPGSSLSAPLSYTCVWCLYVKLLAVHSKTKNGPSQREAMVRWYRQGTDQQPSSNWLLSSASGSVSLICFAVGRPWSEGYQSYSGTGFCLPYTCHLASGVEALKESERTDCKQRKSLTGLIFYWWSIARLLRDGVLLPLCLLSNTIICCNHKSRI